MMRALALLVAVGMVLSGCRGDSGKDDTDRATAVEPAVPGTIRVTSSAFDDGEAVPEKYTCHGDGVSPPLEWSGTKPDEAGPLALVVDDPDAPDGGYVHWVVFGLPPGDGALAEGTLPDVAREVPGSGGARWRPPCPPSGTHHYRFTLYAFPSDFVWEVRADTPLQELLDDIADKAVAWGRLIGTVSASGGDTGGGY